MKICNQCGQTMDTSSKYCLRCGSGNLRTEGGGETTTRKPITIGKGLGVPKKSKKAVQEQQGHGQGQFDDWDDNGGHGGHYDGDDGDELIEHNFKNPNAKVPKKKPKNKKAPKKRGKITLGKKSQTSEGISERAPKKPSKPIKNEEYNQQNMGYMDDEQMEFQDEADYDNSISGYGTAGDDDAVTVGEWIKTVLITAIPVYGIIKIVTLAFGSKKYEKQSLRNWAQATVYLMGGSLVLMIVLTLIKKIIGNLF